MDAQSGRETPPSTDVEPIAGTSLDEPISESTDDDDPELDAWLAARDIELDEMAWAMADRFRDEVGQ